MQALRLARAHEAAAIAALRRSTRGNVTPLRECIAGLQTPLGWFRRAHSAVRRAETWQLTTCCRRVWRVVELQAGASEQEDAPQYSWRCSACGALTELLPAEGVLRQFVVARLDECHVYWLQPDDMQLLCRQLGVAFGATGRAWRRLARSLPRLVVSEDKIAYYWRGGKRVRYRTPHKGFCGVKHVGPQPKLLHLEGRRYVELHCAQLRAAHNAVLAAWGGTCYYRLDKPFS